MTEFEKADLDGNGSVDQSEWDKLLLDDKRMQIEDENSKRDSQLLMVWFSLAGLLLYPVMIIVCNVLGQEVAADNLTAIAPTYCIAVVGIVTAFFGFTNIKKKGKTGMGERKQGYCFALCLGDGLQRKRSGRQSF